MESLISVILPIYNAEPYLQACIDSIVGQTLEDIEIICVNDGSTDGSEAMLLAMAEKDPRIKVFSQENQGAAIARNQGMKMATGEYIAFMDPDDWYPDNNVLDLLYRTAKEQDVLICGGGLEGYIDGEKNLNMTKGDQFQFRESGLVSYRDYQFDHGYTRFIYKRSFLEEHGIVFPDYRRYQDPPFMVRAMCMAGSFYALKEPVYCYRMEYRKLVLSGRKGVDFLKGLKDVAEFAAEKNLDILFQTTVQRLNDCFLWDVFPNINIDNAEMLRLVLEIDEIVYKKTKKHGFPAECICQCLEKECRKRRQRARYGGFVKLLFKNPGKFLLLLLKSGFGVR